MKIRELSSVAEFFHLFDPLRFILGPLLGVGNHCSGTCRTFRIGLPITVTVDAKCYFVCSLKCPVIQDMRLQHVCVIDEKIAVPHIAIIGSS